MSQVTADALSLSVHVASALSLILSLYLFHRSRQLASDLEHQEVLTSRVVLWCSRLDKRNHAMAKYLPKPPTKPSTKPASKNAAKKVATPPAKPARKKAASSDKLQQSASVVKFRKKVASPVTTGDADLPAT